MTQHATVWNVSLIEREIGPSYTLTAYRDIVLPFVPYPGLQIRWEHQEHDHYDGCEFVVESVAWDCEYSEFTCRCEKRFEHDSDSFSTEQEHLEDAKSYYVDRGWDVDEKLSMTASQIKLTVSEMIASIQKCQP